MTESVQGQRDYTYKIAPVGRRLRVRVGADEVTIFDAGADRALRHFSLHGVTGGRWSETFMRYAGTPSLFSRALILKGAGGALALRQGDGRPNAGKGPNSTEFYAACAEILAAAATLSPGLRLGLGPARYVRVLVTLIGAFSALFGLAALAGALLALVTGRWLEVLVFSAAALGAGGAGLATTLSFNPFRKAEFIDASALSADLAARAGDRTG